MAQGLGSHRVQDLDLNVDVEVALRMSADNFKEQLNDIHVDKFGKTTLHDVYRSLRDIQFQQQEQKTLMNLNRIELFLSGMNSFQEVLDDRGMNDVEGIMAFVWGPMKFLLETTNVNERAFDHVLEVYQRLGIQILPLSEYKQFFARFVNGRACLLNIYNDIAEFHTTAYRLFSLRSSLWGKLHKATWKDLESTFKHLAASLELHADFIQTHGAPLQDRHAFRSVDSGFAEPQNSIFFHNDDFRRKFDRYMSDYVSLREKFRKNEAHRKQKQKDKVLKWIAAPMKTQELHRSFVKKREPYPETGRWLYTRYDAVSNWMREDIPQDSALWVYGKKGMGKSILSSLVVTRLQELVRTQDIPKVQTCYFYCQDADPELNTYFGILRGIVHQLVSAVDVSNPDLDESNEDEHDISAYRNKYNGFILPLCDDKITNSGGSTLSTTEGCLSLIEAFFEINPRLYIVVDGLDECAGRVEIQQIISFLVAQVSRLDEINQGQLRVLFMSQSNPEVKAAMSKPTVSPIIGEVELKATDNTQDIRTYVKSRLDPAESLKPPRQVKGRINPTEASLLEASGNNFNLGEQEIQRIEEEVSLQSEGLFLYAVLAVDYLLNQWSKEELLRKVSSRMLPEGITKMYDMVLESLKEKMLDLSSTHWDKTKLLLGWLACAHRPLKWHEIQAIIAYDLEMDEIDFDLRMIRRENINNFLGSLVEVLPGDEIRLMHSTAKDHLVSSRLIHAKSVQCDLAILCLRYLSLRCFAAEDYSADERHSHIRKGYFSFQDYAVPQWYKHINTVIRECHEIFSPTFCHNAGVEPGRNFVGEFGSALARFISAYDTDIKREMHPEFPEDDLSKYISLPFYPDLARLWNHIFTHQKASVDERNEVGIGRLQDALTSHREVLASKYQPDTVMFRSDTMETYYGPNLFKCKKTLCKFFYEGFKTEKDREAHHNRHDRPYPCPIKTCNSAPVGFSSNKDKERHGNMSASLPHRPVRTRGRSETDLSGPHSSSKRTRGRNPMDEYCSSCLLLFSEAGLKALNSTAGLQHPTFVQCCSRAIGGCPLCHFILARIKRDQENDWPDDETLIFHNRSSMKDSKVLPPWIDILDGSLSSGKVVITIYPYAKHAASDEVSGDPTANLVYRRPLQRDVKTQKVFSAAVRLYNKCRQDHRRCRYGRDALLPTRVIGVGTVESPTLKLLINDAEQEGMYVALSYCWGGKQPGSLVRASLGRMTEGIRMEELEQTVRDAVVATRKLGFRYLWVDAYCIIQDCAQDKAKEIGGMALIYKNAAVMIAAGTAARARDGFLATRRTYIPEEEFLIPMSSGGLGTVYLRSGTHMPRHAIDTRGWVLQEFMLSSRILFFSEYELLWQCQETELRGVTGEGLDYLQPLESLPWLAFNDEAGSNFGGQEEEKRYIWMTVVEQYSRRLLSDPGDRLDALKGITLELQSLWRDTNTFGLWKKWFIEQLTWSKKDCEADGDAEDVRSARAPSWSWASLNGRIRYTGLFAAEYAKVRSMTLLEERTSPHSVVLSCPILTLDDMDPSRLDEDEEWITEYPDLADVSLEIGDREPEYLILGKTMLGDLELLIALMVVEDDACDGVYRRVGLATFTDMAVLNSAKDKVITLK
ncbi:zinc finger protein [Colletotrichum scovillei]|uniref:Zinc finger protein n=1 Tax=Colletotrichum scovillei TaxID=1209932 RepID=A0A9P7QRA4_9PEZI|nr:zinc finger protein [Colletotrichum scovillei]KAG7041147.1 zinc finger protein [Colletotrichum scovillei]